MGLTDLLNVTGGLEKLRLSSFSDKDFKSGTGSYTVMYNPTSYSKEVKSQWIPPEGTDPKTKDLEFRQQKSDKASFEFLFDATGASPTGNSLVANSAISKLVAKQTGENYDANEIIEKSKGRDVEDAIQKFFEIVGDVQGDTHIPNYIQINWGTYEFQGVLTTATVNYKLFNNAGIAIRATINVSFEEAKSVEAQNSDPQTNSPDLSHLVKFEAGDSIHLLANRIYGDPQFYLEIARVNNVKNFRKIGIGETLVLPPINKKNQ